MDIEIWTSSNSVTMGRRPYVYIDSSGRVAADVRGIKPDTHVWAEHCHHEAAAGEVHRLLLRKSIIEHVLQRCLEELCSDIL